jgi:hypothetical protein
MLALTVGGCTLDTPGYSHQERFAMMRRNAHFEAMQFNDDFDYIFELRPATQMSIWDIVHRD